MEKEYMIEKTNDQKQTFLRKNKVISEIENNYINLSEDIKNNLRNIIKLIFLNSKSINGLKEKMIEKDLYPEINFVSLSKIYSDNEMLQLVFLEKINNELHYEINKNKSSEIKKIK